MNCGKTWAEVRQDLDEMRHELRTLWRTGWKAGMRLRGALPGKAERREPLVCRNDKDIAFPVVLCFAVWQSLGLRRTR